MDFLKGLSNWIGGGQATSDIFSTLIAGASGGFKQRPQWRDLEFMNDATNRLWPDEIARQGDFLKGLAGPQGEAHNTFQDATYAKDTERSVGRIQTMASELGMSNWELAGQGNAGVTPVPPPGPSGGGGQMGTFLQGLVPLQVAKMQTQAQLATARLNAETQRYAVDASQGKGDKAKAEIAQIKQAIDESIAREVLAMGQHEAVRNDTFINTVRAVASIIPEKKISLPGITTTARENWKELVAMLASASRLGEKETNDKIRAYLNTLPKNEWDSFAKDAEQVFEMIHKQVTEGAGAIAGALGFE